MDSSISPARRKNSSVSPLSIFAYHILLFEAYTVRIDMSSWLFDLWYHVMPLFIWKLSVLWNLLCLKLIQLFPLSSHLCYHGVSSSIHLILTCMCLYIWRGFLVDDKELGWVLFLTHSSYFTLAPAFPAPIPFSPLQEVLILDSGSAASSLRLSCPRRNKCVNLVKLFAFLSLSGSNHSSWNIIK